jgi:hypothetical protein
MEPSVGIRKKGMSAMDRPWGEWEERGEETAAPGGSVFDL